jgi:hypothetical protein
MRRLNVETSPLRKKGEGEEEVDEECKSSFSRVCSTTVFSFRMSSVFCRPNRSAKKLG